MEPIAPLFDPPTRAEGGRRLAVAERVVAALDRDLAGPSEEMGGGVAEPFFEACFLRARAAFFSILSAAVSAAAAAFRRTLALSLALRAAFFANFDCRLACLNLSLA